MDANDIGSEAPKQAATRSNPMNSSSLLDDARDLWGEVRGLSHDRFQLAALETQQAGVSLVNMIIAGALVAVLLCGAWMGLLSAAVLALIENGIMVRSAILIAVAINLLLALILCRVIQRKSRFLKFPATLHSLKPAPSAHQDTEKS